MDREEELRLVLALRGGDARAFTQVYSALRARLYAFLLRLSRRVETAEDLCQEAFVRLARAAPRLAEDTRLVPFLFTIARNLHRSHRRWEMLDISRVFVFGTASDEVVRCHDAVPDTTQRLRDVEAALGALSVGHREVLLLVGVEGLTNEEAAAVLGLGGDALRQRLSRARRALDDELARRTRARPTRAAGGLT